VRVGGRAAEVVDPREIGLDRVGHVVEEFVLVERPVRAALAAGAVVGHHHDQRVLELPGLVQVVQEPADLVVGVRDESGVGLRHPDEGAPFVVRQ
jgi:hypothetical protein